MKHPLCRSCRQYFRRLCAKTAQLCLRINYQGKFSPRNWPGSNVYNLQRLLDHLEEAHFYSRKDLESIGAHLKKCRRYIERGKDSYSPHLLTLLDARIQVCSETLARLELAISHLTPDLTPKYDKLVSILRTLAGCNTRSKVGPMFHLQHRTEKSHSFPMKRSMSIWRNLRNCRNSSARTVSTLLRAPVQKRINWPR